MRATKESGRWIGRLIEIAAIALVAMLIGSYVFDSIPGFFLAEATLGGFAGGKYRCLAFPGAFVAFFICVGIAILVNNRVFQGEGRIMFLILLAGMITFSLSALAAIFFIKKLEPFE